MKNIHLGDRHRWWTIYNQWSGITRFWKQNWTDFTIINLAFEYSKYKGRQFEIDVGFMGINIHLEFVNKVERSVFMAGIDQDIATGRNSSD